MRPELAKKLADKTREDYDALADAMDVTRRYIWEELSDMMPEITANDRVLDIGCGNGRMVQTLKTKRYVGLDLSPELVKRAQARFPEASFVVGDALKLPFSEASFEYILSIAVLHQIPGMEARNQALKEAFRVLKPGGIMVISVWNLWRSKYLGYLLKSTLFKLFWQHQMDFGDVLIPWKDKGVARYYHAFCARTVRRMLVENGFQVLKEKRGLNYIFQVKKPE
ncbi:MAG: class I SAM-dependent methyltransferase [bacterium]